MTACKTEIKFYRRLLSAFSDFHEAFPTVDCISYCYSVPTHTLPSILARPRILETWRSLESYFPPHCVPDKCVYQQQCISRRNATDLKNDATKPVLRFTAHKLQLLLESQLPQSLSQQLLSVQPFHTRTILTRCFPSSCDPCTISIF